MGDLLDNFFSSNIPAATHAAYNPLDDGKNVPQNIKINQSYETTELGYKYIINSKYVESLITYDILYDLENIPNKESFVIIDPEDHRRSMVIKFKNLNAYQINKIFRMCCQIPIKALEPIDVKIIRLILSPESTDKYNVIADGDILIRDKIIQIPINQDIPEETQFMFNSDKLKQTGDVQKNIVEQMKNTNSVTNEDLEAPSSLKMVPYNRHGYITSLKAGAELTGKAVVKKIYPLENNFSLNRINHFERQLDNILLFETRLNDSPAKLLYDTMEFYNGNDPEIIPKEDLEMDVIEDIKKVFSEDFIYPKVLMSEKYRDIHKLL